MLRPKGDGLTLEEIYKKESKYDTDFATQVCQWLRDVAAHGNVSAPDFGNHSPNSVQEALKDGVFLLQVLQAINPAKTIKINSSTMAFKMMENIAKFLEEVEAMGVSKIDLFQTVDLFEGQNMPQVINGLAAFGRKLQTGSYDGPIFGPSAATENKREFTEEQLRAGERLIGLRAGSNQVNFGERRPSIRTDLLT